MRRENIYIGQVKKCLNYDRYMQDGDESILLYDEKSDKTMRTFTEFPCDNTMIVNNFALLVKLDENTFIWINKDGKRILGTTPTEDEPFFVNDDTLNNFFSNKSSKGFIRKKRLMLEYICDPRIPYGIDH